MPTMICDFCNKKFNNIICLNTHKRKSKYCLNIQNIEHRCKICCKEVAKYNFEIQKLQIQKEIEKDKIEFEIEKERIKNNGNIIINMLKEGIITFEQFKECFNCY